MNEHYRALLENKQAITPEAIKDAYLGIMERGKTILEVFQYHNNQVEALLNKDFVFGTFERYKTALSHTRDFIEWKYRTADLEVKKLNTHSSLSSNTT